MLTIHAEAEGIVLADPFDAFLGRTAAEGIEVVPLGMMIPAGGDLPALPVVRGEVPGREGWVACQGEAV